MYMTHTFASRETLSRAHDLLERLGFRHRFTETGVPRIVVMDGVDRMSAALMLINVVENGDPHGFPSLWDQPGHFEGNLNTAAGSAGRDEETTTPAAKRSTLGWHPLD
jgi:hypothetical protein